MRRSQGRGARLSGMVLIGAMLATWATVVPDQVRAARLAASAGDSLHYFHGTGGTTTAPFTLRAGRVHVAVHAGYDSVLTADSACLFTAAIEHLDAPHTDWDLGTAVTVRQSDEYSYRVDPIFNSAGGRYRLVVSPGTNCRWEVSVIDGLGNARPLSINKISVWHRVNGNFEEAPNKTVHLSQIAGFGAYYTTASSAARVTGTLTLIHAGKTISTIRLLQRTDDNGYKLMFTGVKWRASDAAYVGQMTARIILSAGNLRASRSIQFTLAR